MHVLKDCEVSDAILFLIASHTSLMQVHTKATDTPNKFPIVQYSAVGARWYKAIASRRFGVTAFHIVVSRRDISSPISQRMYVNFPRVTLKLQYHSSSGKDASTVSNHAKGWGCVKREKHLNSSK